MIGIIDYDAGNIKSVEKAIHKLGYEAVISRDREILQQCDHLILPGVGAFGDAMEKIRSYELEDFIHEQVDSGKPFLGICLGLQLLFASSDEAPGVKGLDLLPGKIIRIPDQEGLKIPHMGWNSLKINSEKKLFAGIEDGSYVYFVHSYYLVCENEEDVAATTDYSAHIHAAVEHDNIYACQFHPEKSSDVGLKILENFLAR